MQKAKAFNQQVFLEFVCCLAFAIVLFHLTVSNQYLAYVTPRMKPYLYLTSAVILLWSVAKLGGLFRPQHKKRVAHCFVLAIPALLLLLPHGSVSESDYSLNYAGANPLTAQSGQPLFGSSGNPSAVRLTDPSPYLTDNADASDQSAQPQASPAQDQPAADESDSPASNADLPGLNAKAKTIVVSNDAFSTWLFELYYNIDAYQGYTISMTGYVLKDSQLMADDEFVPARLMMSCCVADLAPVGILCKYDKSSALESDSWVTVEGTLDKTTFEEGDQTYSEPLILVTKVTPAEKVDGYVYPY